MARFRLAGAQPLPEVIGEEMLPGRSHYLLGRDASGWHTGVPSFSRVRYRDVYPGVDWVYYGREGRIEYDLVVAPGADPRQIALEIEAGDHQGLSVDPQGALLIDAHQGIRFEPPVAYQMAGGQKQFVDVRYMIQPSGRVGFAVGEYDGGLPLVIDPVLVFSEYLGGTLGNTQAFGVAVDSTGVYITGATDAGDFPFTSGAAQEQPGSGTFDCSSNLSPNPCKDAFVTKLSRDGTTLIYSTYLGGSDQDSAFAIAVDGNMNAVVTGGTNSDDFPVTPASAFRTAISPGTCQDDAGNTLNCEDAFVAVLNDTGSLLTYSSYLGGARNDFASGVAVDLAGDIYIAGFTDSDQASFPASVGPPPGGGTCTDGRSNFPCGDAFVAKLVPTAFGPSSLGYARFLGGNGDDFANALAVDTLGNAYVVGLTAENTSGGATFPNTNVGFQSAFGGVYDGFIAVVNPTGTTITYASFLGGNDDDQAIGIALDSSSRAVVAGFTHSANFWSRNPLPGQSGRDASNCNGCYDAFVMKVDPKLAGLSSLVFSTYLGGTDDDRALAVAVDGSDNIVVAGATGTPESGVAKPFPLVSPLQAVKGGATAEYDGFVAAINSSATALTLSTYIGGGGDFDVVTAIRTAPSGEVFLAGRTNSISFPITLDSRFPFPQGIVDDAFVARIDPPSHLPAAAFSSAYIDFGNVGVGSTSAVESVRLLNMGTSTLDISAATVTGPNQAQFQTAVSTNCGSTLPAGASCFFDLTFAPQLPGVHDAFLTITDNAAGSPHSIILTGTGTADFNLTVADNSEDINAGQTASYTLTLTPLGGFNQSITFSCSNVPPRSTCTPPPATSLDGTNSKNVSLSIATQSRSAAPPALGRFRPWPQTSPPATVYWLLAAMASLSAARMLFGKRRRAWTALPAVLALTLVMGACGGGGGAPTDGGTPAGTYTITVTANSGSITKTTNLTLIVR
jgi:hypothetical protein